MNNKFNYFICVIFLFAGIVLSTAACSEDTEPNPGPASEPSRVIVDVSTSFQTIAGFGGANRMWGTQFLKPAEAKKAFGTGEDELGLSIFRVRIASNKNEWPRILESVQEAQKYGVKIQASPWSPPPSLKDNNSDVGGSLPAENYAAFKDHINEFIAFMKDNGVDIYAVSIQNEPDIAVSYESCDWRTDDMQDFIREYGDDIEGAKLAAPESYNFNPSMTNAMVFDEEVAQNFDILAGHIYGGGLGKFPLAESKGKEIWMTEYLLNKSTGNSGAAPWTSYSEEEIWEETMVMLNTIHQAMENNWNAYIWWYLQRYYSFIGDGEEGTTNGEILKRGWAFSHFSQYIRPGYVRVEVSTEDLSGVDITAYNSDDEIVVVLINTGDEAIGDVQIELPSLSSANAVVTSATMDKNIRDVILSGSNATLSLLPKSVTTLIAKK